MITVNFIGGAKKWFNLAHLSIDKQDLSIKQLLKHLVEIKPKDTIDLVAVSYTHLTLPTKA